MVYLALRLIVITDQFKIVTVCAGNVPRVHGHKCLDDDASGCSSINDPLVKLHPLVHQTCFEFMRILVVSYSEGRLFRITNLINCMYLAHSIELIDQI